MTREEFYEELRQGIIERFWQTLSEEERKKKYGYKVIPKKYHPHMLYRETVRYSQQVKRYFELFGEENVKVTIFDEYIKDKIRFALSIKPKRHDFLITPNSKPYMKRHMNVTGG